MEMIKKRSWPIIYLEVLQCLNLLLSQIEWRSNLRLLWLLLLLLLLLLNFEIFSLLCRIT